MVPSHLEVRLVLLIFNSNKTYIFFCIAIVYVFIRLASI